MAAGLHYRLDWNVLDSYFQMQEVGRLLAMWKLTIYAFMPLIMVAA